ncbi:MAG TPA: sigma-54 dependent transcriptional regulator [Terriglobia bacterium]|nr:sigma-54 dependent transcriptional regulator [Terriglobia bacterium]
MKSAKVLVVEDDLDVRQKMLGLVDAWGYKAMAASSAPEALQKLSSFSPLVVISDLSMPGMNGMELLKAVKASHPDVGFIMLTGHGSISEAVEATRLGAFNFLEKPLNPIRLEVELRNCVERYENREQLEAAQRRLRDAGVLGSLVGTSRKMREVMSLIQTVAPSRASVLILGESGTGKELAARTIHELSPRGRRTFVAVNCAAMPETLIESELFGHERGAFTGALTSRPGCFELSDGGTLLLDEIGEMPAATQAKLLRVLEDSKVRRLGAKAEILVDTRVLAATNKVPEEAIKNGQLRRDLFYRLNVVQIVIPPLREHVEDIEVITARLLEDLNRKHQRAVKGVTDDVFGLFRQYEWPGNVRELRNKLERAVVTCSGETLTRSDFSLTLPVAERQPPKESSLRFGLTVAEAERRLITETLVALGNNRTRAAEVLGITKKTLYNKLKQYEMERSSSTPAIQ